MNYLSILLVSTLTGGLAGVLLGALLRGPQVIPGSRYAILFKRSYLALPVTGVQGSSLAMPLPAQSEAQESPTSSTQYSASMSAAALQRLLSNPTIRDANPFKEQSKT